MKSLRVVPLALTAGLVAALTATPALAQRPTSSQPPPPMPGPTPQPPPPPAGAGPAGAPARAGAAALRPVRAPGTQVGAGLPRPPAHAARTADARQPVAQRRRSAAGAGEHPGQRRVLRPRRPVPAEL